MCLTEGIPWSFGTNHHDLTWTELCFEYLIQYWYNFKENQNSPCFSIVIELSEIICPAHLHSGHNEICISYPWWNKSSVCLLPVIVMPYAWLSIAPDGSPCKDALHWGLSSLVSHCSRMHGGKSSFPQLLRGKIFLDPCLVCARNIKDVFVFLIKFH